VAVDPYLAGHKRELLTNAARDLNAAQMLRFDERTGNLYVAELGRVASHFYLQYTSVQTYNELLTKHMSDSEVGPNPSTRNPVSSTSAAQAQHGILRLQCQTVVNAFYKVWIFS
jgi:replicative superfamily II helicase